jgi:hypothetical protein
MNYRSYVSRHHVQVLLAMGQPVQALLKTGKQVDVIRVGRKRVHTFGGKVRKTEVREYRTSGLAAGTLERWGQAVGDY